MKINKKFTKAARRMLSVAVCLVMMFTTFFIFDPSVLKITASAAAWNGSTDATSGTDYTVSGTTMHIKTPNGLAYFISNLGSYSSWTVYLDNDVDLNSNDNFPQSNTVFTGTFDGQGKTIYNYKNEVGYTNDNIGFFNFASGATFLNIKFSNAYVGNFDGDYHGGHNDGTGYGILVGKINSNSSNIKTTVENVTVEKSTVSGRADVGGIFGTVNGAVSFSECHVSAKIDSVRKGGHGSLSNCLGGMIGYTNSSATIKNCTYSNFGSDGIYGHQRSGGMIGHCDGSLTIKNSKNYGTISASGDSPSDLGGLVGKATGAVDFYNNENRGTLKNNNVTGGGMIGWLDNGSNTTKIENCNNYGSISTGGDFAGGIIGADDGTGFGTVSNAHNFGAITGGRYAGGIVGRTRRQMKLLNCVNESSATITTTTNDKDRADTCAGGIIGKNQDARQVVIENCTNNGSVKASRDYAGGIMGYLDASNSGATFKNCVNNGSVKNGVSAGAWYAGGILAASGNDNPVTFENCRNNVDVGNATNYTGGITGYVKGPLTMKNSVNTGNISGAQFTAGLCAWIEDDGCEITNCLNTGTVSTNGQSNGAGILSTVKSQANNPTWKITNCVNTGDIKNGASAIGGILGYMGYTDKPGTVIISDCINKGNMAVSGNDVGGIVGNLNSHGSSTQHHKYINCYNYGNISSNSGSTDGVFVGGIVGKEYGFAEFNGCRNYGTVNASSTSANSISGGICGWIEDDISSFADCINYGNVTAKNNIGGILGEVSNAYNGTTFSFTKCGNYGDLSATTNNFADMGGIVGKLWAKERTVKIYMSKCFNGNGNDGRIASVSYKAKNAGGLFGEVNQQAVIADSYNNASSIISSTNAGGLIGTNNGNTALAYNSFSVTGSVSNLVGSGSLTQSECFTNTMGKGTAALATLNTTRSVSGIGSVGNAYDYKQGVNKDYPALKWQLNTLTKNVGRNLIADLIADTAKSGYRAQGLPYDIKLDGVTKTYYPTYTKTENGVKITYDTMSDLFTLSGTPTATGTFEILSATNPEAKSVYFSAYYVGGNAMGCSATVYTSTISRTSSTHALKSLSTGERVEIFASVNPNVPVQFDNYKFHASMDYTKNATATSDSLVDLHSTYSDLGTPTKEGYKFLGWYTVRAKGDAITDGSTAVNSGTPIFDDTLDRDFDIYAHWDPITYTIVYNGNGATSGSTTSSSHTYDEAKNLTMNGFFRAFDVTFDYNYSGSTSTKVTASSTFNGWATSADGAVVYQDGQPVLNLTAKDKDVINLYANWTDKSVSLPSASRTGYTFDGWYTEATGGTKVEGSYTPTETTTLYAHWTPITYTVEYNPNGGSGTTASATHTYDVAQKLTPNGFERKFTVTFNYNDGVTSNTVSTVKSDFNGWLCSKDKKIYADEAEVKNLTDESETITMTAQWTDRTVTVPETERENYIFLGWFDAQGNEYKGTFTPTSDLVITAKWQEKAKYTVTFKNGDEILQQSEWYIDTTPVFKGTEPTKESDNRYEYTFSGWSPEITKVTGEAVYEAQFTATEHHFMSVKVDGETHRSECACGYKLESTKHNIELKDGKYTCKDCGYVVPDFTAVTADGATLTKTLRADMTTKYLVATVSYPNASKPNKEGKYFVYWYDKASGEIVSAFTTYSFFLTKEVDIIPIFATQKDYYTERAKATTVLRMVGCKQNEDKSYSILAERSISSSAGSINSHGMIYTTDASLSDSLDWEHRDVDGVKLLTAQRTSTVRTGLYEAKITGAESGVVYARPYIVLVNSDGTTKTMYGKVVTYNLTSTQAAESDVLSTDSYDLSDISAEEPVAPTEPTEKNPLEKIADFFAKLVEIIKTILSFFGLTGVAR